MEHINSPMKGTFLYCSVLMASLNISTGDRKFVVAWTILRGILTALMGFTLTPRMSPFMSYWPYFVT